MSKTKRALSLIVIMSMLMAMMVGGVIAGYEDFTDKSEIKCKEAVEVMNELNILNGKDDGSYFDPQGIVTRAEMAKMISVSLNGGKDPILASDKNVPAFTDTKGNWAEAYIAYCADLKIIAGKGDGTFGPAEPINGTTAAKMMLVAMGYSPEKEKLTGAGWDLSVDILANKAGIYTGTAILYDTSAKLSRDDAAQIVYNGLRAETVLYREGSNSIQPGQSIIESRFGVIKVTGIVVANEKSGIGMAATAAGKTTIKATEDTIVKESASKNYISAGNSATFNVTTDADMLGMEVTIYVKPVSKQEPNPSKDEILGEAVLTSKNATYSATEKLVNDSQKSNDIVKTLKKYDLKISKPTEVYVNFASAGDVSISGAVALTAAGGTTKFIDNTGDGNVDLILCQRNSFGKVTAYGDEKITISNLSGDSDKKYENLAFQKVAGVDKLSKGDYIFFFYDQAKGMYHAEKANSVTVTVTSTVMNNEDRLLSFITAGEKTYKLSPLASMTDIDAASGAKTQLPAAVKMGKAATLILDPNGDVVYVDGVPEDENTEPQKASIKITGIVSANEHFGLAVAAVAPGKTTILATEDALAAGYPGGKYLGKGDLETFNVSTSASMLGMEVTFNVIPEYEQDPSPAIDRVVGDATITGKNKVYSTFDKLVDDSQSEANITTVLQAKGLEISAERTAKIYVNFGDAGFMDAANAAGFTGRGYETSFIDNTGDGMVDVMLCYRNSFGKVTAYGDGQITIKNLSNIANGIPEDVQMAKVIGADNVALGDYVFYSFNVANEIYYIEKAEGVPVTARNMIESADNRMLSSITDDSGKSYMLSGLASARDIDAADGDTVQLTSAVEIGKPAILFLDKAGYVVYVVKLSVD